MDKYSSPHGFCPRVPVHKSLYKGTNDTQQLTNDSETKKAQWLFPCESVHQDRTPITSNQAFPYGSNYAALLIKRTDESSPIVELKGSSAPSYVAVVNWEYHVV